MKQEKHYKTLFKATSLFGIVEIIRLVLRVITNSAVGYFFGPSGFGLYNLVDNTIQLISSFTNFGINFTGIREISANKNENPEIYRKSIVALQQFSVLTGLFAALISIIFANQLSLITFNSVNYFYWFLLLSIYFIANGYTQSYIIFLEGSQHINRLLQINVVVNALSTVIILVAFYFFHLNGIIVSIILNALIALYIYVSFSGLPKLNVAFPFKEKKAYFNKYITSGGLLAINTFVGFLSYYLIRLYLKNESDELLGFYGVANVILVSYLGIVFIATGKFFFPKLSSEINSLKITNQLVNNQLELSLLIILPALLFIYTFGLFLVKILFSAAFLPVYQVLVFGLFAIVYRAFNYAVGYLILAHQNYKHYFYINLFSDLLNVILTILFYKIWGIIGIGVSLFLNYLLSAIYIYFYSQKIYLFKLSAIVKKQLFIVNLVLLTTILCFYVLNTKIFSIIGCVFFILSTAYSLKKIDEYLLDSKFKNKVKALF